ncbi:MAG: hypothetical protein HC913_20910 [Microscillaceae bacterium]|nr:hypothetical protein [Microscillaceae bacterium]
MTFVSPKSILVRIADMFQRPATLPVSAPELSAQTGGKYENTESPTSTSRSKLNVSLDDLKIISTALLHYKRSLARMGEQQKAEGVNVIDQKFYHLITQMERQFYTQENPEAASAA